MLEPAPGRLSMTIDWPRARESGSLSVRATKSAAPAGANPTTSLIGLFGYGCACSGPAAAHRIAAVAMRRSIRLLPDVLPEKRQRALAGELRRRGVVRAAMVAVEAVSGAGVVMRGDFRVRGGNCLRLLECRRLIQL